MWYILTACAIACLASCRVLKEPSNQYSCLRIPLTRSAIAFSALWFVSVMLIVSAAFVTVVT